MNERDKHEPRFTEVQDLDQMRPVPANKNFLSDSLRRAVSEAEALANYYDNVSKQLSALADQVDATK